MQHDSSRTFNHRADLKGGKAFGRDALKVSVRLELFKKRYALFTKSMGEAFIPLSGLQGVLSYEGVTDMMYKGIPVHIHYRLEVRRHIDKKITIKQYKIEKKYPVFDIKKSEEMPSNLLAQAPQPAPGPAPKTQEQPQQTKPKAEPVRKVTDPGPVKAAAKKQEPMDEEIPTENESSGVTHPLAGDLKILSKDEFTEYLNQLKAAKPLAEKQGIEIKDLVAFDNISFSVKYLTIYIDQLTKQQEDFINAKTLDSAMVAKCRELINALNKRKGQMNRNMQSGKLTPDEYLNVLQNEFDGLVAQAKFVKKATKNQRVFKFIFAKVQIIDSEIKELEEYIKQSV